MNGIDIANIKNVNAISRNRYEIDNNIIVALTSNITIKRNDGQWSSQPFVNCSKFK